MITQNQLLMHSVYTAITESSSIQFNSQKEKEEWQGKRTTEIFQELKEKYFPTRDKQKF